MWSTCLVFSIAYLPMLMTLMLLLMEEQTKKTKNFLNVSGLTRYAHMAGFWTLPCLQAIYAISVVTIAISFWERIKYEANYPPYMVAFHAFVQFISQLPLTGIFTNLTTSKRTVSGIYMLSLILVITDLHHSKTRTSDC